MQAQTPSIATPPVPTTAIPAGRAGALEAGQAVAAVLALFLGAFVLWGVGFAGNDRLHNAAHDTRHSNGFPCH